MKLQPSVSIVSRARAAFTMIEIAISLAVIAFAIVAIIGVLPMGLNVQRENREDTLVNVDGQYLLEAIRAGAQGFDNLTNFVEFITIESWTTSSNIQATRYFYKDAFPNAEIAPFPPNVVSNGTFDTIRNGHDIVGLLTTPKFLPTADPEVIVTNRVTAFVHSLTGPAVEQHKTTRDLSFGYQFISEVIPYASFAAAPLTFNNNGDNSAQNLMRSNYYHAMTNLCAPGRLDYTNANMFDARFSMRWPAKPDGTGGARRQQFRTVISSRLTTEITNVGTVLITNWYFAAQQFAKPTQP